MTFLEVRPAWTPFLLNTKGKMEILMTLFEMGLLAQAGLETGLGKIVNYIRLISMILCLGALIYSGITFATGRVEAALWGLVGGGICGLSWVITQKLYEAGGAQTLEIPL